MKWLGALFFTLFLFQPLAQASELVDLTYPFDESTIYWPTAKGFELHKVFAGMTEKGYFYAGYTFCAPEHGGTHMDAPIHFAKGHLTVDRIPLAQLQGSAAVIGLEGSVGSNADYRISVQDIIQWEAKNGALTAEDIVLFRTGWERFWGDKKKYLGTDKFKDVDNLHFPGLSVEAAAYLKKKNVKGVGLDTPSLDYGQSKDFKAHRTLLGANIYGLENVAQLGKLPPRGAHLIVAPMKIGEGTGAPTRIFAEIQHLGEGK